MTRGLAIASPFRQFASSPVRQPDESILGRAGGGLKAHATIFRDTS
jgi:hypothetical protein